MTKVIFKINPKEEAKNIPDVLDLGGYGMLTSEAYKRFTWITKKQLYKEVKKLHKKYNKKLEKSRKFSVAYWNRIEKDFVKTLESLTKIKLEKNKVFYFTPSLRNSIADVRRRKNAYLRAGYNERQLTFMILHELIHLYYADFLIKLNLKKALVSPLVEGVDYILLFKSPLKTLLHPSVTYNKQPFIQKNPQFMAELEKLWKNRESFESFLKKAIKLNENTKGVIIC